MTKQVINHMGSINFEQSPLLNLKAVSASCIFGEPSYYQPDKKSKQKELEQAIDSALDVDFRGVLDWAVELRKTFYIRVTPQVIVVRALKHPKRSLFTAQTENQGYFAEVQRNVLGRGDDPYNQLQYYVSEYGSAKQMPTLLKKSWKTFVENQSDYVLNKYKTSGHLIDIVRLSHAKGNSIGLLLNNNLEVPEDKLSIVQMRSDKQSWTEIFSKTKVPHMAMLRSLISMVEEFTSTGNDVLYKQVLEELPKGVLHGKQYPFRYYNAYNMVEKSGLKSSVKKELKQVLSDCLDLSISNLPEIYGKTMILTDNSGSAWGNIPTPYGTATVAEIGNLSAVLTAYRSTEGIVGIFGDLLKEIPVDKSLSILETLEVVNKAGKGIGMSTEQGLFTFFDTSIKQLEHYDNVFIYSDQQAGHNQLYGNQQIPTQYQQSHRFWSFKALVDDYRLKVNPDLNVFSVQTAGYNNNVLPELDYRTSILYGWTGKEVLYAKTMIDIWNERLTTEIEF